MWFLEKLNIEFSYDPIYVLLSMYPKGLKTGSKTNTGAHIVIAALLIIAK